MGTYNSYPARETPDGTDIILVAPTALGGKVQQTTVAALVAAGGGTSYTRPALSALGSYGTKDANATFSEPNGVSGPINLSIINSQASGYTSSAFRRRSRGLSYFGRSCSTPTWATA